MWWSRQDAAAPSHSAAAYCWLPTSENLAGLQSATVTSALRFGHWNTRALASTVLVYLGQHWSHNDFSVDRPCPAARPQNCLGSEDRSRAAGSSDLSAPSFVSMAAAETSAQTDTQCYSGNSLGSAASLGWRKLTVNCCQRPGYSLAAAHCAGHWKSKCLMDYSLLAVWHFRLSLAEHMDWSTDVSQLPDSCLISKAK